MRQHLMRHGCVIRRVILDSCSISRLADCPYSDAVTQKLTDMGMTIFLSLDVLMEVMCAGHSGVHDPHRLQHLLKPLQRLLPIIRGIPFTAELLAKWSWKRDVPAHYPDATNLVRDIITNGIADRTIVDDTNSITQDLKRQLVKASRSARASYQASMNPDLPHPSLPGAVRDLLRDRSLLRQVQNDLMHLARDHGAIVRENQFRLLRHPMLQYFCLGYVHLARCAAVAPNNKELKTFPGHNDIQQLPLMPLCDAFVSDDDQLRKSATELRDFLGYKTPWVSSYHEVQALAFTA